MKRRPTGESLTVPIGWALVFWLAAGPTTDRLHSQLLPAGSPNGSAANPSHTIAVLPFANISRLPADDWLSPGITETVTADLARVPGLTVLGGSAFGGSGGLTRQRAEVAGVTWLVTGGYQRVADRLRITARLVEVSTGTAIETVIVDGTGDDVLALQDQIVEGLRGGLPMADGAVATDRAADVNEEEGRVQAARPAARPGDSLVSPEIPIDGTTPDPFVAEDVTGGIVIGDRAGAVGVAAEAGGLTGRPSVRPTRLATPPIIDGRLDDSVWLDAVRITEFVQRQPLDGAPATEATTAYLAYDSTHLYFAFHAQYSDPAMMRANRSDRDEAFRDDDITVYFDTFLDQQRAYAFSVNAFGVQGDSLISARGGGGFGGGGGGGGGPGRGGGPPGFGGVPRGDSSWDALFDSAGHPVADGFTAELAIPFKSLRYPQRGGNAGHSWGFQIVRTIGGKDETVVWAPISRDVAGFLPQMGVMEGLTGLSTSRNLEILPTFTAVQFGSLDTGSGQFVTRDPSPEGGLNVKYGVTSNLTADFTLNPDFSQIESDRPQIEVNQRFALFFPELRPFFLEGAEIFSLQPVPVTAVHTRTIVDPRYGAKLTGKVGDTTLGVMFVDDEAAGAVDDRNDPAFGQSAQTFVGRVRHDLYAESHIGALVTDREFLDSYSRLVAIDGDFRIGDTHSIGFRAYGTRHRDLEGLDTSGYLLGVFTRKDGRNLNYTLGTYGLSPDFKTDVGFVRRTDERRTFGDVSYRWWPEHWLINWGPRFNYARNYTFDGILQDENAEAGVRFAFAKSINLAANVSRDMERFGGVNFYKTRYSFGGPINTSRRIGFGAFFNTGDEIFFDADDPFLGRETGLNGFIAIRPIPRLQSQININTSRFTDTREGEQLLFDVKIFRALTTYQFTDRLLFRNISEYNSFDRTLGLNVLFTYRVNAGTVFYVGYDDRYRQGDRITGDLDGDGFADRIFHTTALRRTNRAIFLKLQYLFRY